MGKPKTKGAPGKKCKAKAKPTTPAGPQFSRPWMATFLAKALASADVERGLAEAGVEFGDYLRGRRLDLAFDNECRELDLTLRLAIQHSITAAAARGDRQAAKMVARGELEFRQALDATFEPLPDELERIIADVRAGEIPEWTLTALGRFYDCLNGTGEARIELGCQELARWEEWGPEGWESFARIQGAMLRAARTGVYPLWLVRANGLMFGDLRGRGYGVVIVDDDGEPVEYTQPNGAQITTGAERIADARPDLAFVMPLGPSDDE